MHRYFPHTAEDEAQMLGVVGADRVEDLFASIPADCRHEGALPLTAMTEWELTAQAEALAASMPAAVPRGSAREATSTTSPPLSRPLPAVPNFTPPTRRTSRKSARVRCRASLNSRRSSPVCSAWKWPTPPCTTARPRWPKVR